MKEINLHNIFRYLVSDDQFLSTIIEINSKKLPKKNKTKFNLMANMVTEYTTLSLDETQNYSLFPQIVKSFLTPDYIRLGIKNVIEKDLAIVNISFLNSLNLLLRPELYRSNIDEQLKNLIKDMGDRLGQ